MNGTPWILLRGLIRDSRHWGDFPQTLAARLGHPPVVTLDLPGNGVLHAQASPDRVEGMVAYCRDELRRRGLRPPYRVLAMSLGAMVASAWAQAYPQELDAAVLVNTSLRPFSPFWQRLRPPAYPRILGMLLRPDPRRGEETVLRLTTTRSVEHRAVLDDWVAWRLSCPVTRANALRQLHAAIRFRAPPRAPATRLFVLVGLGDRLVDPRCSQRLAQAWNCPIAAHPSAGHDLPLDDADWVAERIAGWLPHAA